MLNKKFWGLLAIFVITAYSPIFALSDEAKAMLEKLKAKATQNTSIAMPEAQTAKQPVGTKPFAEIAAEKPLMASGAPEKIASAAPEDIFKIINSADSQMIINLENHLKRYPNSIKLNLGSGGATPLHDAAQWCEPAIVRLLLRRGANVNAKNNLGYTPLDFASDANIEILKAAGAKKKAVKYSNASSNYSGKSASGSTRPRLSNGDYTTHTGPRGGVYHYSASGKKVYHKR